MKTDVMRRIDRLTGSPLCHLMAPLSGWLAADAAEDAPVVVCKFFGIGSICLSHGLLTELRAEGRRIVYLSFAGNAPVIGHLGVAERILVDPSSPWRFLTSVLGAVVRLRKLRPAVFLNLEFFSRFAALMSVLSGAPVRAGFHIVHLPVGKLYTHRANLNVYRHIAENFLNVGAVAGVTAAGREARDHADSFPLPENRPQASPVDGPFIVINGESSETIRDLKSWPKAAWRDLLGSLRRLYPAHALVLIGTGAAAETYGEAATPAPAGLVDLVGKTDFDELVALLAGADLVITVDSGPLHLSALMRRPTVGLFGPEAPVLYGHPHPWVRTLYKGLICSPCLALYDAKQSVLDCTDNQCMKQITPAQVLSAAAELLPPADKAARAS